MAPGIGAFTGRHLRQGRAVSSVYPLPIRCSGVNPLLSCDPLFCRRSRDAHLVMLDVLPQWQGLGAARALVAAVAETARAEGAERLIVATTNDDLPALGFYRRPGFTITGVLVGRVLEHHGGVEPGFAGIPVRDEIQMELRL